MPRRPRRLPCAPLLVASFVAICCVSILLVPVVSFVPAEQRARRVHSSPFPSACCTQIPPLPLRTRAPTALPPPIPPPRTSCIPLVNPDPPVAPLFPLSCARIRQPPIPCGRLPAASHSCGLCPHAAPCAARSPVSVALLSAFPSAPGTESFNSRRAQRALSNAQTPGRTGNAPGTKIHTKTTRTVMLGLLITARVPAGSLVSSRVPAGSRGM